MITNRKPYDTDLTDWQWEAIEDFFVGTRAYKWPKRKLVNAVYYVIKTGCQWRNLPHDFPPWKTVYSFFRRANLSGLWDEITEYLADITREIEGKESPPSYAIIDSQSVKTVSFSHQRGIDGGKKNIG